MHFTVNYKWGCLKVNFDIYLGEGGGLCWLESWFRPPPHLPLLGLWSALIMITTVDVMVFLLSEWNGSDPTGRTSRVNLHRRILLKFAALFHPCLKADRRSRHFAENTCIPLTKWHTLLWIPSLPKFSVFVPLLWLSKRSLTISFCRHFLAC